MGGKLPIEKVLNIGIQLCAVLDYLHTRQPPIIFRDLKPANVMLTADGHIFLIDFGIARHFKPGQAKDTSALGSSGYAAPEQYGKMQTTPRADLYALGATLHQMLTGNDPSDAPFHFAPLQLPNHPALNGTDTAHYANGRGRYQQKTCQRSRSQATLALHRQPIYRSANKSFAIQPATWLFCGLRWLSTRRHTNTNYHTTTCTGQYDTANSEPGKTIQCSTATAQYALYLFRPYQPYTCPGMVAQRHTYRHGWLR